MRRLLLPLLLAAALLFPMPAQGYNANRTVQTRCDKGVVLAFKGNDLSVYRWTQVPCPNWTVFENGKYVTRTRPYVDMEGALRSARVWWPRCEPQNYNGAWSGDGVHWVSWFHVCV